MVLTYDHYFFCVRFEQLSERGVDASDMLATPFEIISCFSQYSIEWLELYFLSIVLRFTFW